MKVYLEQDDLNDMENRIVKRIISELEASKPNEWMKTKDAVAYLKCNQSTLLALRTNKTIPFYKLGGSVYYRKSDLDEVLFNSKVA
jgi:excisionase family DNA binding protein